jgi:hypothetical protein
VDRRSRHDTEFNKKFTSRDEWDACCEETRKQLMECARGNQIMEFSNVQDQVWHTCTDAMRFLHYVPQVVTEMAAWAKWLQSHISSCPAEPRVTIEQCGADGEHAVLTLHFDDGTQSELRRVNGRWNGPFRSKIAFANSAGLPWPYLAGVVRGIESVCVQNGKYIERMWRKTWDRASRANKARSDDLISHWNPNTELGWVPEELKAIGVQPHDGGPDGFGWIYFLVDSEEQEGRRVVYVGQSGHSVPSRLKQHASVYKYDHVFVQTVPRSERMEIERNYIQRFSPKYNKVHNADGCREREAG